MRRRIASVIVIAAGTVLCSFQQPPAPHRRTSQATTGAAPGDSTAKPKPTQSRVSSPTSDTDAQGAHGHGNENVQIVTPAPERPVDLVERGINIVGLLCTLVLAGVGICGVRVALRTLTEMRGQRRAMLGQLRQMRRQVEQMEAAAAQTDRLVTQATVQAEKSAVAADAAKRSADALVNSERAWLLTYKLGLPPFEDADNATHAVHDLKNFGRTPAIVLAERSELQYGTVDNLRNNQPPDPSVFSLEGRGYQRNYFVQARGHCPTDPRLRTAKASNARIPWVCGLIRYRDVLASEPIHETWYCYVLDPQSGKWAPAGSKEHNRAN